MRVVLDTNTLASGIVAHAGSPSSMIIDAWRQGTFILVSSEAIMAELSGALAKPYFAARLAAAEIQAFLDVLTATAIIVTVRGMVSGVASHPEDDRILECAVVGEALYLVTGDRKLQALHAYQGIQIVSPRRFLEVLREGGS